MVIAYCLFKATHTTPAIQPNPIFDTDTVLYICIYNPFGALYNVQCTNSLITFITMNTSSSVVPFKVTWYFREIMRNWCVGSQVVVITSTLCRCLFLSTILPFIAIDIPAELLPLLQELLWQMALQQTWLMPLTWIFQFFVITLLIKGQQFDN